MKSLMPFLTLLSLLAGCSNGGNATADNEAFEAYIDLEPSITKAINVAFAGVNSAATENLAPFTVPGDADGTLVVMGQVDQGTGSSKTVRVDTIYNGYSDDGAVLYATTPDAPPLLALELRGAPYGVFNGSFAGIFTMSGALSGTVTVRLAIDGELQPAGKMAGVERVPYSTHLHGTAVSEYGTFAADFTR